MTSRKFYCGIGSRTTPEFICRFFTTIAKELSSHYTLRSGAADGADKAFEDGAGPNKEIWLPWKNFNKSNSKLLYDIHMCQPILKNIISEKYYNYLKRNNSLSLHLRNVHQIYGDFNSGISEFVLCWTNNCEIIGGTATAIKIAKNNNVPVYNFGSCNSQSDLLVLWDRIKMLENISSK
jgi:hypothetical protein